MAIPIRPKDLDPGTPNAGADLIFDSGTQVLKTKPKEIVDAAVPLASQVSAETGASNDDRMSSLRVKQAIEAQALALPFSQSTSYAPGTVGRSLQRTVYVTDPPFNAIGDGSTNDAPAFNAAFTYLQSIGGGTLNVPAGNYRLGSTIKIGENTALVSAVGTSYFKGHDASFLSNGLGYTGASDIPAYEGNSNIIIDGGVWEGFAGDEIFDSFTHFAIGRGKNIIIRNCVLKDNIGGGHFVDMASCDGVLFENCQFLGYALGTGGEGTAEALQIDADTEGSFPYFGVPKFRPCRNITVRRCRFGPNPSNHDGRFGTIYTGVGSHASVQDEYAENIVIEDNYFDSPQYAGVRAWKWRNVHITKNTFLTSAGRGIHITATPAGGESSKDINRVQTNQAQASDGIYIEKNRFVGTIGQGIYVGEITFGTDTSIRNDNISVIQNVFVSSPTSLCVDGRDCRRLTIADNQFNDVLTLAESPRSQQVIIANNVGDRFASVSSAVNLSGASDYSIVGNILSNMQGRGVLITQTSPRGVISGNQFIDFGLGAPQSGIAVQTSSSDVLISNNKFFKASSANTAVDLIVSATCLRCDAIDNTSNTGSVLVQHAGTGGGIVKMRLPGSPEGAITAPPGSECNDTINGVKYIKKSGTGNTGWKLVTQAS